MTSDSDIKVFCGGPFWNSSLLLDNTWPQFTDCFMNTVLIWVPCGFLFLFLPRYVTSVNLQGKTSSTFPFTAVIGIRLFCCIALVLLSIVQIVLRADSDSISSYIAGYLGDALYVAAYILMAVMTLYERVKGAESTATPFFFWLLSVICHIVPFYSGLVKQTYRDHLVAFSVTTLVFTLNLVGLLLTGCVSAPPTKYYHLDKPPCPQDTSTFPSFLFFWWISTLMVTGYRRTVEESDFWKLPSEEQSDVLMPTFQRLWRQEENRCHKINSQRQPVKLTSVRNLCNGSHGPGESSVAVTERTSLLPPQDKAKKEEDVPRVKPSLMRVLAKMHTKDLLICFVQKIFSDVMPMMSPLLLGYLMSWLQDRPTGRDWQGYVLCLGMFLVIILKSVFFAHSMFGATRVGIRVKATLIAAVYRKALYMSSAAKNQSTLGEVVNLMSVDAQRILNMMAVFFFIVTSPVPVVVAIVLLYANIGPAIFAGVGVLLLMLPMFLVMMNKQQTLQSNNLRFKDNRIRLYNEILGGIKVLKLYAWEPSFREKIREVRLKEVAILFTIAILNTLVNLIWDMAPFLVTLATFAVYVLGDPNGTYLDARTAFVALSLFNILKDPLILLASVASYITQAKVSIGRINNFLHNEELDPNAVIRDEAAENMISIQGEFTWDRANQSTLKDIDLEVKEGQLVAVVGTVGCGKSSLINAILGEMEKVKGKVVTRGHVAYVPQQAWIQNATVRDNILFDESYIRSKYNKVLDACELERDLSILSAGDQTEIGEKGINLSGGQKQRVSVARAVYSESDLYLLDDPLSAVDSHVGRAIFNKVIGPNGILRDKTRVLVTHGVHWLPMVDQIIVMDDGKITERGSYEELMSHDGPFAKFLLTYLNEVEDEEDEEDVELAAIRSQMFQRLDSVASDGYSSPEERGRQTRRRPSRKRRQSESEPESRRRFELEDSVASVMALKEAEVTADVVGRLTTDETMETGKVQRQVFKDYVEAAGPFSLFFAFISFCIFQAFSVSANFWLNTWTADTSLLNDSLVIDSADTNTTSDSDSITDSAEHLVEGNHFYLSIYGVFGIFQMLFLFSFNYVYWTRMVVAARVLHSRLADRILRAPMAFFDTTPIGRILNRVSRDIETVDNTLPMIISDFLATFALVLVTIVVILIQTPMSGLVFLPLLVLYYACQRFYVPTARQLQRIEAVTRTPIYTLFSETMTGASSIRAYGASARFIQQSKDRTDRNQIYFFATQAAKRWLQFNLDILAATVVLAASIFTIVSTSSGPGDAGLSISYALQVSGTLTWMTRQVCEFETNIVSVERLQEYSQLETEAELVIPDKRPDDSWPQKGEVTFNNYQTRYREGLELVLKGVNCVIDPGMKVGIVGRTGAGKSSLTLSLFRLIEAAAGCILIDGVNIADMGLHDLRSRLTILPQDPVIFMGSLRMNLDPFDQYTDQQLWTALDRAHLRQSVLALPGQLSFLCAEEGSNLSVGQRQLLCLARTLLRETRVLVLDEATAAVDMETDALIQNTIRSAFHNCTIITIAHRLNTIMDYDKIIVMDSGMITEMASPNDLLSDKNSAFYSMAKDAGLM